MTNTGTTATTTAYTMMTNLYAALTVAVADTDTPSAAAYVTMVHDGAITGTSAANAILDAIAVAGFGRTDRHNLTDSDIDDITDELDDDDDEM